MQLCFIAMLFAAFVRQNAYGLIYYVWLTITMRLRKRVLAIVWRAWLLSLSVLFLLQYANTVGIPDSWVYPWNYSMVCLLP